MRSSLHSIRLVRTETTGFDSTRLQLLVTWAAGVLAFLVTLELGEAWGTIAHASALNVVATYAVFFGLSFCLSHVVNRALTARGGGT